MTDTSCLKHCAMLSAGGLDLTSKLCFEVVRILATVVCPHLPFSYGTDSVFLRVREAARILSISGDGDSSAFESLRGSETRAAKGWMVELDRLSKNFWDKVSGDV